MMLQHSFGFDLIWTGFVELVLQFVVFGESSQCTLAHTVLETAGKQRSAAIGTGEEYRRTKARNRGIEIVVLVVRLGLSSQTSITASGRGINPRYQPV